MDTNGFPSLALNISTIDIAHIKINDMVLQHMVMQISNALDIYIYIFVIIFGLMFVCLLINTVMTLYMVKLYKKNIESYPRDSHNSQYSIFNT